MFLQKDDSENTNIRALYFVLKYNRNNFAFTREYKL